MNVRFLEAARNDLREAIRYYNEQRPGLGREFRDEVNATIEWITRLPEAWRPWSKNTRRCRTHRFPYGVIYQLKSDEILIVTRLPTPCPHPTSDPDLAFIVGIWDRLANECRAKLIEVIKENLPG